LANVKGRKKKGLTRLGEKVYQAEQKTLKKRRKRPTRGNEKNSHAGWGGELVRRGQTEWENVDRKEGGGKRETTYRVGKEKTLARVKTNDLREGGGKGRTSCEKNSTWKDADKVGKNKTPCSLLTEERSM